MSLLNDALKRAKLEALEREADGRADYGLPTPRERHKASPARRLGLIVAVLGLAAAGGLLGWLLARAGSDGLPAKTEPARSETSGQPAVPPIKAPTVGDSQVESGRSAPTGDVASGAGSDDGGRNSSPSTAGTVPPTAETEAAGEDTAVEPGGEEPSQDAPPAMPNASAGAPALADGASFVRVFEIDGTRLELQGIAFQGGSSVAIINDLMVSVEDMVGGFEVVGIEPERVQLQGRGLTLYVTLH